MVESEVAAAVTALVDGEDDEKGCPEAPLDELCKWQRRLATCEAAPRGS